MNSDSLSVSHPDRAVDLEVPTSVKRPAALDDDASRGNVRFKNMTLKRGGRWRRFSLDCLPALRLIVQGLKDVSLIDVGVFCLIPAVNDDTLEFNAVQVMIFRPQL